MGSTKKSQLLRKVTGSCRGHAQVRKSQLGQTSCPVLFPDLVPVRGPEGRIFARIFPDSLLWKYPESLLNADPRDFPDPLAKMIVDGTLESAF